MTAAANSLSSTGALTCVVTDDDALSRQTLEGHIAQTEGLELVGSFADGMQLLSFLHSKPRVDILFLDVQMPELSGLEVVRLLPTAPAVVLITSRTDFAVEAFELRVVDYVVKPVPYSRFLQTIARVQGRLAAAAPPPTAAPPPREAALFVKSGARLVRIPHDEILYVEAVNDQAVIVTTTRQLSANQVLRDVESRLPSPPFVRVHRSYVVNRYRIEAVEASTVVLEGGRRLPIGRTYLADVLASFQ